MIRTVRHNLSMSILLIAGLLLAMAVSPWAFAADDYQLSPESTDREPGVPVGRVEHFEFNESKVFPGTQRDAWVYIPAQYDGTRSAGLMVFQDGHAYVSTNGLARVPIVFDNLIARGEIPLLIGLFINPGHRGDDGAPADRWGTRNNRSLEYDSLGDAYARFLMDELIPRVTNQFHLKVSQDPRQRAIAGISSGGICAFTVAWERPDAFGKVLSHVGSFVNIRGGHVYPALIRKTERKSIRVFLQDGSNDLNNLHGNWPLANQEMASALAFAGYDYRFEYGDGAHNGRHGGAILPDSLRWLWRPELTELPHPLTRDNLAGDEALVKLLPGGGKPGDWEVVGQGYGFTDGACGDGEGNFYFADLARSEIYRKTAEGVAPEKWLENAPKISGMKFGADGHLYAATQGEARAKRIVAIDPASKAIETIATDVQPNDLAVSRNGWIYFTDTDAGTVVRVPTAARSMSRPPVVAGGINKPNGIALSLDQRFLFVSEYGGVHVWSFLVGADGGLTGGERYMTLRSSSDREGSGGDGMAVDSLGRCWITSYAGIQVFDADGRFSAVLSRPQEGATVSCDFAGPKRGYLYVCSTDKVFRRAVVGGGISSAPQSAR